MVTPIVFLIGPFPPPVHGFSLAMDAMRRVVQQSGVDVRLIDHVRWTAVPCSLRLLRLVFHRRDIRLYLGLSAGKGQFRDMLFIAVARLCSLRLVIHHHSFAYLDRPTFSARLVCWLGGPDTIHIVLCGAMRDLLCRHYVRLEQIRVLSNAALLPFAVAEVPKSGALGRVGFLGNITLEKGIDRFLVLISELRAAGLDILGCVAGPIVDSRCRKLIERAVAEGSIIYHGPVYDQAKQAFLSQIDVLVFPSRYVNEAEPLAVLEALGFGIPVVATGRGCLPGLVEDEFGILLDRSAEELGPAIRRICEWSANPGALGHARAAAISKARSLRDAAIGIREGLLIEILDP